MVYGLWFGFTVQSCSWPDSRGDGFGSGSEAGSYLRLIDSCITQLKAEGPSGTCNESKEEEDTCTVVGQILVVRGVGGVWALSG